MGWLRSRITYAKAAATAALVLAMSGLALASGSSNRLVRACASKSSGALRLITPGGKGSAGRCSRREQAISWNQKGVQGVPGRQGKTGPQGPGATEYTWTLRVCQTQTLGPGGPFTFEATCTTSGGQTVDTLYATNSTLVNLDEFTMTSGSAPSIAPDVNWLSQQVFTAFDAVATSGVLARHASDTVNSPPSEHGQLTYTIAANAPLGFCEGSLVWIPAS